MYHNLKTPMPRILPAYAKQSKSLRLVKQAVIEAKSHGKTFQTFRTLKNETFLPMLDPFPLMLPQPANALMDSSIKSGLKQPHLTLRLAEKKKSSCNCSQKKGLRRERKNANSTSFVLVDLFVQ